MRQEVYVEVEGLPIPQGSMRAMKSKVGRPFMIHSNPLLKPWREAVSKALASSRSTPLCCAVEAHLSFYIPKPKNAPRHRPHVRPDLDKLVRAALDACTMSGVLQDDGQVCVLHCCKVYCSPGQAPRMKLLLTEME